MHLQFLRAVEEHLLRELPRVSVAREEHVRAVLDAEAREQLWADALGLADEPDGYAMEVAQQLTAADILVLVRHRELGSRTHGYMSAFEHGARYLADARADAPTRQAHTLHRSPALARFAQDIGRAVICAELEPSEAHLAPDETEGLELTVTDLTVRVPTVPRSRSPRIRDAGSCPRRQSSDRSRMTG